MERMTFARCKGLIAADLFRYEGDGSMRTFWKHFFRNPGFIYTFWVRVAAWSRLSIPWRFIIYPVAFMFLRHCMFRYGICIPVQTSIGPGLCIRHFGGITIHGDAVIGANCNLSQNVTVGIVGRGERAGAPVIGDNAYLGVGCVVIGKIAIGDNVAVGANAVVTKDIEPGITVGGVPATEISRKGSRGLIERTNYPAVPA